jgi:acetyl esterase/lipase
MSNVVHVLYFNGLGQGRTRKREKMAINYLAKRGIEVTHVPVKWYIASFDDVLDSTLKLTKEGLKEHGTVVLVGSSAGGSLVVNIMSKLHNPNLYGVTLCSRLQEKPLPWWDKRDLARMSHLDTNQSSQAFFDSVTYCGEQAIPKLTDIDKEHLILVQQWADFVVPRPTMSISGAQIYRVHALGHGWGIAMGVRRLPQALATIGLR